MPPVWQAVFSNSRATANQSVDGLIVDPGEHLRKRMNPGFPCPHRDTGAGFERGCNEPPPFLPALQRRRRCTDVMTPMAALLV